MHALGHDSTFQSAMRRLNNSVAYSCVQSLKVDWSGGLFCVNLDECLSFADMGAGFFCVIWVMVSYANYISGHVAI